MCDITTCKGKLKKRNCVLSSEATVFISQKKRILASLQICLQKLCRFFFSAIDVGPASISLIKYLFDLILLCCFSFINFRLVEVVQTEKNCTRGKRLNQCFEIIAVDNVINKRLFKGKKTMLVGSFNSQSIVKLNLCTVSMHCAIIFFFSIVVLFISTKYNTTASLSVYRQ